MANKLHSEWLNGRYALESMAKSYKTNKRPVLKSKVKELDDLLKKFNKGLGPKLEELGKAYQAKKDDDVKKLASTALAIAEGYKNLIKVPTEGGWEDKHGYVEAEKGITMVVGKLHALVNQGTKASVAF